MMEQAANLPLWAAIAVSAFLIVGASLTLIGTIGFIRLQTFYERIHAPTLGTSWGTGAIVMASMLFFTVLSARPVLHEILIGIFVTVTTPVTLMLLARAALHRDRAEGNPDVPASMITAELKPSEAGEPEKIPPAA
jgi:multicomponent K+:H+ antiporter subunit G